MIADNHISSVVEQHEGMVDAGEENQGRIGKMWVHRQGGIYVFAAWHTEGWTPRNEASTTAVLQSAVRSAKLWLLSWNPRTSDKLCEPRSGISTCR